MLAVQQDPRHTTATKTLATAPYGKNWSQGLLVFQEMLWKLSDMCEEVG